MPPSATPTTQRTAPSAVSATPGTQSERRSHQVPIDATKGHARHPKDRCVTATKRATMSQPSVASATPATQSERRCHQCYACRAVSAMPPSPTPATQGIVALQRPSAPPKPQRRISGGTRVSVRHLVTLRRCAGRRGCLIISLDAGRHSLDSLSMDVFGSLRRIIWRNIDATWIQRYLPRTLFSVCGESHGGSSEPRREIQHTDKLVPKQAQKGLLWTVNLFGRSQVWTMSEPVRTVSESPLNQSEPCLDHL